MGTLTVLRVYDTEQYSSLHTAYYYDTLNVYTVHCVCHLLAAAMCWLCCWQLAVVPTLWLVFQVPHHCKYFQPSN